MTLTLTLACTLAQLCQGDLVWIWDAGSFCSYWSSYCYWSSKGHDRRTGNIGVLGGLSAFLGSWELSIASGAAAAPSCYCPLLAKVVL